MEEWAPPHCSAAVDDRGGFVSGRGAEESPCGSEICGICWWHTKQNPKCTILLLASKGRLLLFVMKPHTMFWEVLVYVSGRTHLENILTNVHTRDLLKPFICPIPTLTRIYLMHVQCWTTSRNICVLICYLGSFLRSKNLQIYHEQRGKKMTWFRHLLRFCLVMVCLERAERILKLRSQHLQQHTFKWQLSMKSLCNNLYACLDISHSKLLCSRKFLSPFSGSKYKIRGHWTCVEIRFDSDILVASF